VTLKEKTLPILKKRGIFQNADSNLPLPAHPFVLSLSKDGRTRHEGWARLSARRCAAILRQAQDERSGEVPGGAIYSGPQYACAGMTAAECNEMVK
jgi:hypothetical protein